MVDILETMTINAAPRWTFRVSFSNGKLQRLRSKVRGWITKKSEDIESVPATKVMWDTAFGPLRGGLEGGRPEPRGRKTELDLGSRELPSRSVVDPLITNPG